MKVLIINEIAYDGDFCINHSKYGFDEISFDVYPGESVYPYIQEENVIKFENKVFAIKSANDNGKYIRVEGSLDMSYFEQEIIKEIGTNDKPLVLTISQVFGYCPSNWKYKILGDTGITAEWKSSMLTFKDVMKSASEAYNVHYDIDYTTKTIEVRFIDSIEYSGNYITDQLNIISFSHQSDSYDICTRLYYYGKDENGKYVSFASINGGKEYVENFSYTDKIISKAIIDEETIDKQLLLSNAQKTLATMCVPDSSYTFQISRLQGDDYALSNLKVNELVKYLDSRHKREIMHRIVEFVEYPNNPINDEITLSSTVSTIEDEVTQISNTLANNASVVINEASKDILGIVKNYTSTGLTRLDQDKILVLNALPLESATGILMFDKFGLWWNNHYEPHVLKSDGTISTTTWTKLIDIETGEIYGKNNSTE